MDLQQTFYFIAIMFMVLSITLVVFIAVIFFLVYRRISRLQEVVTHKFLNIMAPAELAVGVGSAVAKTALKRVKKMMDGDDKA